MVEKEAGTLVPKQQLAVGSTIWYTALRGREGSAREAGTFNTERATRCDAHGGGARGRGAFSSDTEGAKLTHELAREQAL